MPFLSERGFAVEDMGPATLEPADDYPDYIMPLALKVAGEKGSFGIVIGASGQGEANAANRIKGARASVYYGPARQSQTDMSGKVLDMIASMREHGDANILALGARFLSADEAKEAVMLWLTTPFSNDERHIRRIKKLDG